MDLLTFNQFTVLLWKNFTLKRRQLINLILEVLITLMFPSIFLLLRTFTEVSAGGPHSFIPQSISTLPSFLQNPQEWELIYMPSNVNVVKEITENMKRNLNISIKVQGFSSETEFERYVKYDHRSHKVLAAVVFDCDFTNSNDPLPLQVKYHLRFVRIPRSFNSKDVFNWKTSLLFSSHTTSGPRNPADDDGGSPGYIREGFLAVQQALDKAIMLYHGSSAAQKLFDGLSIFIQRFPHPAYSRDGLVWITRDLFPLMFVLMFSPIVLSIMRSLVWEKQNGLKEYQLINGLRNWMIWASHFFTVFFFYIIMISLICVLFFVKIFNEPVFRYSDYGFVFVFFTCYAIASIFFAFMVSTFFSKVRLAVTAGSMLYFASFFAFKSIAQYYDQLTLAKKVAACLSCNVALALGVNLILQLEIQEVGVKWHNLWTPANLQDNLIFAYILGMLLLDAFLYGLVTWYVETVFPGQYGMPQPWFFFLTRSYWFGQSSISKEEEEMKHYGRTQSKYFEAEPVTRVADIQIEHLYKEFGNKVAVNNMSMNLYKGQITVLLGENGAGKTTTLSVLTGCSPPTRGEAYINGYAVSKHRVDVRKHMGFCPQQNWLFGDLTLSEHLYFYSMVKGKCQKIYPMEIDHMLFTFNLQEKRDTFSELLSGGMKRKLSLMIALIGGTKVVILDEPTTGMDPVSRRATWSLLQEYKQDRTILLTTHYMDEADVLGDRIAIMVKGALQCCGSSFFLKQIYGAAYHIVLETDPQCDVGKIVAVIQSHVPDATLEKYTRTELSFILPKEYAYRFKDLLNDLKQDHKELGIAACDASVTTMEEVFLKVHEQAHSQVDIQPIESFSFMSQKMRQDMGQNMIMSRSYQTSIFSRLNEIATIKFNTGFPLYCQQFRSMFIKRALFSWRNWKLVLLQILITLAVTVYLLIDKNSKSDMPARDMDLSQYGRTIVPYSVSGNSDLALKLIKNLNIFLKLQNQELRKVQGNVAKHILENQEYRFSSIIALAIKVENNRTVVTILFNNEAYHSAATSLAVLDSVLFMSLSGPTASIKVSNKPQPLHHYGSHFVPMKALHIVLVLAFGMAIMFGGFGFQTVMERTTKAKHIQFVSGACVLTYWLSALLCDLICFSILCCLFLGVFKYCEVDYLVEDYHFLDTMMIFMLYGWSVVPLMYLGSFLFSSSAAAFVKLTLFNYVSTSISIVIDRITRLGALELPASVKTFTDNVLRTLPSYNFAMSVSRFFDDRVIKKLCSLEFQNVYTNCSKTLLENNIYSFGERGIAKFLITLAALGLFYLLLLFFLETAFWRLKIFVFQKIIFNVYNIFVKGKKATISVQVSKKRKDENVENERQEVQAQLLTLKNNPLLLKELTKIYFKCPAIRAVRNISLVVKKSECFGLLGLNGAGKTSIFKISTGDVPATSGKVFIDGISITENVKKVRSRIGYCPQSDPVLGHMTGRELLIMYARLRGVPEPHIYEYVETFLHSVHLEPHADKFMYTYSGANKRRLTTAAALMGKSSVVFLDEPSLGMDLMARRLLWDTVTLMCKTGKAIVITSHSMEECEALCTRLAIMVKGRFNCLGSPQHLKNKFSDVYTLTAKIKMDKGEDRLEKFKEFIASTFPGSIITQEHQGIIDYHIPRKEICWGKAVSVLEETKALFKLEDYSISQITLEQVFLTIANIDKMESSQEIKL
ncbi:ATP-binding cassette sub-family A member 3 [Rhinolophus ferrumequinum]|uniref:ATP-binding cassette sub-family A member 3 n=1 Tax=Rhinolophus ferrumequinum TaxID=59479 RepID=UPI00140F83AD|nr:ATP-binding cassette sub-family A member 3 [Rhinolophus ferrumequinum]